MGEADRRQGQHHLEEEPLRARQGVQVGSRSQLDQMVRRLQPHLLRAAISQSLHRSVETHSEGGDRQVRARQHQGARPSTASSSCCRGRKFDVSALYYLKSNYTDDAKKKAFKDKYGYDLAPPTTFQQMKDQAIFFSNPPNFYGTEYAGKEEAINGRFYEMVDRRRRRVPRLERQAHLQFGRGRSRAQLVRRSLQGQGRAAGNHQLSLGRSRPGFRLGNGRARPRLAGLGDVLQ